MTNRRDERIAEDVVSDKRLMCYADGCPNRWSVWRDGGKSFCSAHAWTDARQHEAITREQNERLAAQAQFNAMRPLPMPGPPGEAKRFAMQMLAELRQTMQTRSPTAWIDDLEARRARGLPLTDAQRRCLDDAKEELAARAGEARSTQLDEDLLAEARYIELPSTQLKPDDLPWQDE